MVVLAVSSAQSVARASGIGRSCSIVYIPPTTSAESSPMLWPKLSRACGTGMSKNSWSSRIWASSMATIVPIS